MLPNNKDADELPDLLRSLRGRGDGLPRPDTDYFENLAERCIESAREPARVRPLRHRTWLAVAAAVLLVLTTWFLTQRPAGTIAPALTSDQLLADIDHELIEDYVSEYAEEYDTDILTEESLEN